MSGAAHTPEPWAMGFGQTKDRKYFDISGAKFQRIAELPITDDNRAQQEANAHLIAAAPKLRDLLFRVMEQCENDFKAAHAVICELQGRDPATQKWPEWTTIANTKRWFDEIRADLAQAEGISSETVPDGAPDA